MSLIKKKIVLSENYNPLSAPTTHSLRHSISGIMPAATMRRPLTAPTTRSLREFYEESDDEDFSGKPTIPKSHMPHSHMKRQVSYGWGQGHTPRYVTVNTARHTIKRAQNWRDLE